MILVLVIYPLDVEWFNWVFAVSGSGQFRRLGPRKLPNETITECTEDRTVFREDAWGSIVISCIMMCYKRFIWLGFWVCCR